jgi:hypothetical protein
MINIRNTAGPLPIFANSLSFTCDSQYREVLAGLAVIEAGIELVTDFGGEACGPCP